MSEALTQKIKAMNEQLNEDSSRLRGLDQYFAGEQPAAFMSEKSRQALGPGLSKMAVNFPRLAVTSLQERLEVTGFRLNDADQADPELWRLWKRNRMRDGSAQAHLDALVYGRSYALVWANRLGEPAVTVESPQQMAVLTDPVTREVTMAFKRWTNEAGQGRGMLYTPDFLQLYSAGNQPDPETFSTTGWNPLGERITNPLGVVPVVPILNRGRLLDVRGVSEMRDILPLSDALNKIMGDAMVTSEFFARPRRWATGLEIVEDDDGNAVNPFSDKGERIMQSESPDTKFGQFEGARLDGYSDLTAVVTQQIGALTGLPPHYLGLHGDQPASADAMRSAEASLVSRVYELQRTFGNSWADVMSLMVAIRDGLDPLTVEVETVWADPETRTPAQDADAAAKLAGIGVPLETLLADSLGWEPARVASAVEAARRNALLGIASGGGVGR